MAAKTPSSVKSGSLGSYRLLIVKFSDLDDTDTWASGLDNEPVAGYWIQGTDNPSTQASTGIAVAYSAGTFTFYPGEDSRTATLYVIIGIAS